MLEDDEKAIPTAENAKETVSDKDVVSIFSEAETRTIVKEFISAYITGELEISFMTAEELVSRAKACGQRLDLQTATNQELELKTPVIDLIAISAGRKEATPKQRNEAIDELFGMILKLRSSLRLKGKFMASDVEKRLNKLEEDLAENNRLLSEAMIAIQALLSRRTS